jgi:hypothetical protein
MKKLDATRIAAWRWKPGQSGNPSGRPKHDLVAEIATACFENNAFRTLQGVLEGFAEKATPTRSRN